MVCRHVFVLALSVCLLGTFATRLKWMKSNPGTSDGCGPNPISVIMSALAEFGPEAVEELLLRLKTDKSGYQDLLTLLQEYDDCVRTGEGSRY